MLAKKIGRRVYWRTPAFITPIGSWFGMSKSGGIETLLKRFAVKQAFGSYPVPHDERGVFLWKSPDGSYQEADKIFPILASLFDNRFNRTLSHEEDGSVWLFQNGKLTRRATKSEAEGYLFTL